jgi:hypothetical protein
MFCIGRIIVFCNRVMFRLPGNNSLIGNIYCYGNQDKALIRGTAGLRPFPVV